MNCKKCGKKLDAEDRFCSLCGAPVEEKETLKFDMSQLESMQMKQQKDRFDEEWEREERKEKFTFMIFGVVIVVLVIAIVGGVVALLQSESGKNFANGSQLSAELQNELEQSQKREEVLAGIKQEAENAGANNQNGIVTPEIVLTPELSQSEETQEDSENGNGTIEDNMAGSESTEGSNGTDVEDNIEGNAAKNSEYIIFDSDVRYLTSADLNELTAEEIRIARNEIFARHGRMFDSQDLKEYFESKSWYVPTIPAVEFSNSCLSEIEQENLNFIINYEKAHNIR